MPHAISWLPILLRLCCRSKVFHSVFFSFFFHLFYFLLEGLQNMCRRCVLSLLWLCDHVSVPEASQRWILDTGLHMEIVQHHSGESALLRTSVVCHITLLSLFWKYLLVCVCVCVCHNEKRVPDEWQARQATQVILQVSSSKHNAKKITVRRQNAFEHLIRIFRF